MYDNKHYNNGSLWLTRKDITTFSYDKITKTEKKIIIPKGNYVILLSYVMNRNFTEHVMVLWKNNICFIFNADTAYHFNTDPKNNVL